jgi:hypothetical protein
VAEPRAEPFSPRTVEIRPPSLRDETTIVVRLAVVIVAIVGFYLANTAWDAGRSTRTGGLLPYQTLVSDADGPAQRMFRALQEGLLEAERGRTALGGWPAIDTLAEQGIPPFASDPTARGPAYRWTLTRRGTFINYRGTPSAADAPAWLLHIQEPYPGAPPDPSPEDEEHHRLPGNVRELENTIERAVVLSPGPVVTVRALSVLSAPPPQATGLPSLKLRQNIEWVERETIRRALENAGGVKKDAAELMGISQRALSYYLAKYRLDS